MKTLNRRISQAGFTLVELMVAMVIGIFMVLALIALLINLNRNNSEMSKTSLVIENGRFAMYLLEADIAHAGYWGGFLPTFDDLTVTAIPGDVPTALPDPCKAYIDWTAEDRMNLVGIAVQGYEIPAVVPSPTLSVCAPMVASPKASTDVLFVRHVETCVPGVGECRAAEDDELMFQIDRCSEVAPTPPYLLAKYDAALSELTQKDRNCTKPVAVSTDPPAELRRFGSTLYYVRNFANTAGDGIPTLMRSSFGRYGSGNVLRHKPIEALVEGVEGFRVEYGIDNISDSGENVVLGDGVLWADPTNKVSPRNRGDGAPDGSYIRCTTAVPCTAAQLVNAVAVKIYVLVRGEAQTPGYQDTKTYRLGSTTLGPFNDGYKRHLFTQTVRLTNVSSRRETP